MCKYCHKFYEYLRYWESEHFQLCNNKILRVFNFSILWLAYFLRVLNFEKMAKLLNLVPAKGNTFKVEWFENIDLKTYFVFNLSFTKDLRIFWKNLKKHFNTWKNFRIFKIFYDFMWRNFHIKNVGSFKIFKDIKFREKWAKTRNFLPAKVCAFKEDESQKKLPCF